jgi:16S rRNA (guanine527-N7)-methyltransferase
MGSRLPDLSRADFLNRLRAVSPAALAEEAREQLWRHYQELSRWNRTLSLIGPGTGDEVVERHYGEAMAGLELVSPRARIAVDVGSGAGFPGLVLAAARPDLEMTLVEANSRKWAFLQAACRRAALPCRCLNVRVETPLPEDLPPAMDLLTARALRLDAIVEALDSRLRPDSRILFWAGGEERFQEPNGWRILREAALANSTHRRIVELGRR